MPKKPKAKETMWDWLVGVAKRNPVATAASIVAIFAGIPGAVAGYNYAYDHAEPAFLAQRYWVRDHTEDRLRPVTLAQQSHANDLDYLILLQQQKALADAKDDLKRDPNSTSAKQTIEGLQKSILTRQKRLDEATVTKAR